MAKCLKRNRTTRGGFKYIINGGIGGTEQEHLVVLSWYYKQISRAKADLIYRNHLGQIFQGFNTLCDSISVAQIQASTTKCTVIPRGKESNL